MLQEQLLIGELLAEQAYRELLQRLRKRPGTVRRERFGGCGKHPRSLTPPSGKQPRAG